MSRGRVHRPKQDKKESEEAHETNKDEAGNQQTITSEQYEKLMKELHAIKNENHGIASTLKGVVDYFNYKDAAHEDLFSKIIYNMGELLLGGNPLNINETEANFSGAINPEGEPA